MSNRNDFLKMSAKFLCQKSAVRKGPKYFYWVCLLAGDVFVQNTCISAMRVENYSLFERNNFIQSNLRLHLDFFFFKFVLI